MAHFWHAYHMFMASAARMSSRGWFVVFLGIVLWGLFCMRGFGSRKGY
jgi:hypothetical protein